MSEEEKQAIEKFSNLMTKHFEDKKIDTSDYLDYFEAITILNLIEKQQKEIENLKLRKDNKVIINKIDQITKEYYELFNKKMSLESMNINGHRYNAMKMVLEEVLSGQEDECRENTEILSKKEIIERYKNNSLLEKLYEGE